MPPSAESRLLRHFEGIFVKGANIGSASKKAQMVPDLPSSARSCSFPSMPSGLGRGQEGTRPDSAAESLARRWIATSKSNRFGVVSAGPAGAEEHHQVVIIGGGMAGLSCALECYDIQLDTIVLEMQAEVGGQVTEIPFHVRNVAAGVYDDEHPLPLAARAVGGDPRRPGPPIVAGRPDRPRRAVGGVGRPTASGRHHRDRDRGGAPAATRRR